MLVRTRLRTAVSTADFTKFRLFYHCFRILFVILSKLNISMLSAVMVYHALNVKCCSNEQDYVKALRRGTSLGHANLICWFCDLRIIINVRWKMNIKTEQEDYASAYTVLGSQYCQLQVYHTVFVFVSCLMFTNGSANQENKLVWPDNLWQLIVREGFLIIQGRCKNIQMLLE